MTSSPLAARALRALSHGGGLGLLHAVPDAMLVADQTGRILLANRHAETLFLYSRTELTELTVEMLTSVRFLDSHPSKRRGHFADPRACVSGVKLRGVRKDGTEFPVEISLSPLETDQGHLVVSTLRDISDRRTSEDLRIRTAELARLRHQKEELERFTYAASHDLRSPLRAVRNLAYWISSDLDGKLRPETAEYLQLLQRHAHRMDRLLDDVLAYSSFDHLNTPLDLVDVAALVAEVAGTLQRPAGYIVECGNGLPILETARVPLKRIFMNLIENAMKHNDRQLGRVCISADLVGHHCVFTVEDDGPGVPEQFRHKIFDMFAKLGTSDPAGGSGLGLSLVRKAVETAGGEIAVASGPGGRGASFKFTWPVRWPGEAWPSSAG